jgi:pyruvate/2-oxoglutarate dehydrogenase complex dihydrolipoamide dehydrogenase (E3) component
LSRIGRAIEKGETQGFIKISVDAETKQILGAAILGTGGDEVVQVLLDVMYAKAPYTVVERAMHVHPTVAEFSPHRLIQTGTLCVGGHDPPPTLTTFGPGKSEV